MLRIRHTDHRTGRNRRRETELSVTTCVVTAVVKVVTTLVVVFLAALLASGAIPPEAFAHAMKVFQ